MLSYQSSAFFLSTSNRLELLRVNSRHVPILITFDRPNQSPAVLCPGTRWLDAATDISPPLPPHGFVQSIPMGSLREAAADVLYIMNIYTISRVRCRLAACVLPTSSLHSSETSASFVLSQCETGARQRRLTETRNCKRAGDALTKHHRLMKSIRSASHKQLC